jgi:hypothetical protein
MVAAATDFRYAGGKDTLADALLPSAPSFSVASAAPGQRRSSAEGAAVSARCTTCRHRFRE